MLAHQGLALTCPPNSIDAFNQAIEAGADYIETDAHGTRDGYAVLFHDDTLNGIAISDLLYSELPTFVPLLSQVLQKLPRTRFNIDIKNIQACAPVAKVINDEQAHQRILLTSFSAQRRIKTMKLAPGTASSPSASEFAPALLAALFGQNWLVNRLLKNFDAIQIPEEALMLNIVSTRLVKIYHSAGVFVHVWTINDPERMKQLIAAGVDGIVTDRTDLAVSALKN